jgi:epoxyqueuosine reductase
MLHFTEYIKNQYHADMQWLSNNLEKRKDVRLIFPDTKTIIALATSYNFGISHIDSHDYGKLSRYAWGRDYHKILDKKTKKIRLKFEELGINSKFYTDTGPTLDKQWGVKSGLGWQGKNGLLLNKKLGSYFFITIGFLDIEIEADKPYSDYCGACTKCIRACPTDAIIQDKVVDSNKCISYWTIESKAESFPAEIAENLNNWLFGCDICQEVCPWNNHKNLISSSLEFLPRENESSIDLEKLLSIEDEEFNIRFQSSPIKRTKISGLKRNSKEILLQNKKKEN